MQAFKFFTEKVLRITPERQPESTHDRVTRGESIISHYSETNAYVEEEPTSIGWIKEVCPSKRDALQYARNLFPFTHWIGYYNKQWLIGDLVAGITVGCVVVPQGMAYAVLAKLPVEYGLYSSFVGVIIYWFFATSKDITIGPVAVMSTLVGDIIIRTQEKHPNIAGPAIASALALLAGAIIFALGILRLGFVVDFIPLVSIAAFMTGSAISIAAGQVPTMLGTNKLFNTRAATYHVIIDTLKHLPQTNLNAAIGLTALTMLYIIRFTFNSLAKKYPQKRRLFFFINTLRTVFVLLLYILISYLMNRNHRANPRISILKTVPRGFKHMGAPELNKDIITSFASELPVAVIVLLIEHIAISKSFGRVNNYRIDPSQELIAIGITNIIGPFFGGYPATGSFSRTAIKSKAGVRTPFAGVITGVIVLLALYALPAMFFYIPNAALSAVIIHAVGDLITPPAVVYGFWRINPFEVVIYFVGVFVTIFSSIENGIYCTVGLAGGLMLFRLAKPAGDFLGRIRVTMVATGEERSLFRSIDHGADGTNPQIPIDSPHPGVFVFRFNTDFIYPNVNHYADKITETILGATRPTTINRFARPGDRPWNDPVPRSLDEEDPRPTLKGVIFDMSSVANIDVTSTQILADIREQFERHTAPDPVYIHFAGTRSAWTRRALVSAGFGRTSAEVKPVFSVASASSGPVVNADGPYEMKKSDVERRLLPVSSVDRPTFNTDIDEALTAILLSLRVIKDKSAGYSTESSNNSREHLANEGMKDVLPGLHEKIED